MNEPACDDMKPGPLNRLWCWGKLLEDFFLALLLLVMVVLAVLLIVMRNVFDSGLVWGDELLRILVLWLCLVGAMAASRDDNHLTIDVISRFLPQSLQAFTRILTNLFTVIICAIIAWSGTAITRGRGLTGIRVWWSG